MKKQYLSDHIFNMIIYTVLASVFFIVFFPLMYVVSTSFASAKELAENQFLIIQNIPDTGSDLHSIPIRQTNVQK